MFFEIVLPILLGLFPFAIFLSIVAIIIYLIIKRVNDKQKETFEDRDN